MQEEPTQAQIGMQRESEIVIEGFPHVIYAIDRS